MALVAALTGPARLRSGRRARSDAMLRFEHQSVGRLELAVPAADERAHQAVRHLRADPCAFAVIYAVLTRAVEVDGDRGRFRYELVHQLTHGPRPATTERSRLNARVDDVLHLLSVAAVSWTAPSPHGSRTKPAAALQLGPLLQVEVVNRKARTVRIAAAARPLLAHYSLAVSPEAFCLARPDGRRSRIAAPVMARLRLASLIAARWRRDRGQRIAVGDLLVRFAWVELDVGAAKQGAAETAGRSLRPRLREAITALADELADGSRYGAGVTEPVAPESRAALRTLLALGVAAPMPAPGVAQPTLEEGRLRDAGEPSIFGPTVSDTDSLAHDHDARGDSLAQYHDATSDSLAGSHDGPRHPVLMTTVGVQLLGDGAVRLELASGVAIELPALIAQAAGLTADSLAHDHDGVPPAASDSLAYDQRFPSSSPRCSPDSLAGDQFAATDDQPAPRNHGALAPESSSDDSDRARGARLSAALAPPPARTPPRRPPRRREPPRSDSEEPDQRRTA